jgi:transcriptional regulator with XRE-family HTH domain
MKPTQENLASKIGVTQQMISAIIRGECRPRYTRAKRLEKITGIKRDVWLEAPGEKISVAFRDWQIRSAPNSNNASQPIKSHSKKNEGN